MGASLGHFHYFHLGYHLVHRHCYRLRYSCGLEGSGVFGSNHHQHGFCGFVRFLHGCGNWHLEIVDHCFALVFQLSNLQYLPIPHRLPLHHHQ